VLEALHRLSERPDLLLCDGQGYAHPRRFGLACHLGVLTGLPSIGVAKSRLIGTHGALPQQKGAWVPLLDGDETVGAVLRTRDGVAPLYVSIGHRVSCRPRSAGCSPAPPVIGCPRPRGTRTGWRRGRPDSRSATHPARACRLLGGSAG